MDDDEFRCILKSGNLSHMQIYLNEVPENEIRDCINRQNSYGETPLSIVGSPECASYLVQLGAKVNMRSGCTFLSALMSAILDERDSVALALLELGANPNLCDSYGMSPLHLSVTFDRIPIAKAVLAYGGRFDAGLAEDRAAPGQTPIHMIRSCQMLTTLIEAGDNVERLDDLGRTPLFYVESIELADCLLKFGANIMWTDKQGCNPVHHLVSGESPSINLLKWYLSKGIQADSITNSGMSALEIAEECGHTDIAKFLRGIGT